MSALQRQSKRARSAAPKIITAQALQTALAGAIHALTTPIPVIMSLPSPSGIPVLQSLPSGSQPQQKKRRRAWKKEVPIPERLCFFTSSQGLKYRICTSGYSFDWWHNEGSFYEGFTKAKEFPIYQAEFNALELNATHYHWFPESTWEKWRDGQSGDSESLRSSFQYVVKTHKYFTHMKSLNVDDKFQENWTKFWRHCQILGPHLGAILFQFPESFKLHRAAPKGRNGASGSAQGESNLPKLHALARLLNRVSRGGRFVFEFRDPSWYCQQVYDVLRANNWCLAMVEVTGGGTQNAIFGPKSWCSTLHSGPNPHPDDYPLTCDWGVYLRFHGTTGQYLGVYGYQQMAQYAQYMRIWAETGRTVYAAFNNTDDPMFGTPSCIQDSRSLAKALSDQGVE